MEKYVITLEWEVGSGKEFEILKQGYSTLEQAQEKLQSLYEEEVANGWFNEDDDDTEIEHYDTSWYINVNGYEKYCACEIVSVDFNND